MMFEKLKKLIMREKEEKGSMPREHQRVVWKENTNRLGLSGDMAKEIQLNSEKRSVPYSKHYLKARRENFNSPVFDQTEGRYRPGLDIEKEINPAVLEWEE